jgi:hypothetical protein
MMEKRMPKKLPAAPRAVPVSSCFSPDISFAGDPATRKNALRWTQSLVVAGRDWKHAKGVLRTFLATRAADDDHRKHELKRAKKLVKFWLE